VRSLTGSSIGVTAYLMNLPFVYQALMVIHLARYVGSGYECFECGGLRGDGYIVSCGWFCMITYVLTYLVKDQRLLPVTSTVDELMICSTRTSR